MCAYKVTFELRIVGRSAGKWNFLLYDIGGAKGVSTRRRRGEGMQLSYILYIGHAGSYDY